MMNTDITSKSAHKLLQQLENDPQLQSIEDTTILSDEQYPIAFDSSIVNLREMIPLISAVTILRWQDGKDGKQLTQDQLQRMRVQRQKTIRNLCLNPTVDNPWDQIKFKFWKDRITNICLGASQSALQTFEDSTNLKYLFSASEKSQTAVHRADHRNVQGLILFNPIILDSPWEQSANQDQDIIKLLEEKVPLIMARATSTTPSGSAHELQLQQTAQQTVESMKSSLKLLLARIQKFTSHTFHVFLKDLIPGARNGRSLLFTRIVEHRNQYLAAARASLNTKSYSAMDTLKFIEASYVQTNENSVHIAWTVILLHTRELQQPLYQWQASFDPLTRKYEQSKGGGLSNPERRKLKILMAKQITDDEKVILTGLDPTFTIENIDKGIFILRVFQKKLAENASRFQSKKYTPDSRILTYLRIRAQEFKVALPLFMAKRKSDKGKDQSALKRQRGDMQHNRHRSHQAYVMQPSSTSSPSVVPVSGHNSSSVSALGKGRHKGKGKPFPKGNRIGTQFLNPMAPSGPSTPKGKGSQNNLVKGKGIFSPKGKGEKGKGSRSYDNNSSFTRLQCKFCHLHGHVEQNCRKKQALQNSSAYQQARKQFTPRQQLVVDMLEDNLFAPNVCSWCLHCSCTEDTCYPPEEPDFYTEVTHLFQTTLLPYVQNAKLGLAVDNAAPLMPQHLAFDGADWGHYHTQVQNFDNHHYDQFDPSTDSTWEDLAEYHSGDTDHDHYMASSVSVEETSDEVDESYSDVQNTESLHMDTELQDSTLSSENFGSIEEDYDLLNADENLENIQ